MTWQLNPIIPQKLTYDNPIKLHPPPLPPARRICYSPEYEEGRSNEEAEGAQGEQRVHAGAAVAAAAAAAEAAAAAADVIVGHDVLYVKVLF